MKKALIVNDTRRDRHPGCRAVMEALLVLLPRAGIQPFHFHLVGTPWEGDDNFYIKAAQADLVIVNGEGSIHHSNERAQSLARLASFCRFTLRKPAVLLNATLFANDAEIYNNLRNYDLISLRDSASAEEAQRFGIRDAIVCPDLSLFHDFSSIRRADDRALGAGERRRIGAADSALEKVRTILEKLRSERRYTDVSMRRNDASIYQYASEIAALDLHVSGRFHGICYSLNVGTPFISIESNTPKITSLLTDLFGNANRVVDPRKLAKMDEAALLAFAQWSEAEKSVLAGMRARLDGRFAELAQRLQAFG